MTMMVRPAHGKWQLRCLGLNLWPRHYTDLTIMRKFEQYPDLPHTQATANRDGCSRAAAV
jgi:hypothetical protein